jgi:RNA polymerase sigma-70 factor (ECF subfamily)
MPEGPPDAREPQESAPESTIGLLERLRQGDLTAGDVLFGRCLPALQRFARSRLPPAARDLRNTQDLVQDTLVSTLRNLDGFSWRGEGSLMAYLRRALVNHVRSERRRVERHPPASPIEVDPMDQGLSPLERMIGRESQELYERALGGLREDYREAIVLRLEMQYEFAEIAAALGKPSHEAARVFVGRAIVRLGRAMVELRGDSASAPVFVARRRTAHDA